MILQSAAAEHRNRLAESTRSLQKIGNVRDKYRPVATRGRILFTCMYALRSLSHTYVYSLQYFLHVSMFYVYSMQYFFRVSMCYVYS